MLRGWGFFSFKSSFQFDFGAFAGIGDDVVSGAFPRVPEGSRKEGFAAGAPSSGCQRLSMRLELKSSGCMHGWSCKTLCRLAVHEVSGWS